MRPRPAILLTLAYGAGLATGLLRVSEPLLLGVVLSAAPLAGPMPALFAVGTMLGRVSGELGWLTERRRCTSRLHEGTLHLRLRLAEPIGPEGGRVEVQPLERACRGGVAASWPRRQPMAAGVEAVVEGRWIPRAGVAGRPGGTLAVTSVEQAGGSPSIESRLRTALAVESRALYGLRAPLVDALVLGRRGGIDPVYQQRFADAGLVHILSISGFHVGLICAWIFLLARCLRLGRGHALAVAAVGSVAYVAFLGWPAPATRAAALAVVAAHCRVRQRHVHADSLLAATCLVVLLVDPWAVLDLGGWLSAAALWGASRFSRWSDAALGTGFGWRTLGSSVGATLATAPITAAALGTVALAGLALNFVAIPLAAVAVPGVLASLLTYPAIPAVSTALATGAGLVLHLLEVAALIGAAIPGGHVSVEPWTPGAVVPWLAALALGLWVTANRTTVRESARRIAWVGAVALWMSALPSALAGLPARDRGLALHFLDVGQGDAAVLRTPAGHWIVVDAGPAGDRTDAGRRVVAPFLARQGARRLDLVVVSHEHADHLGGVPALLDRFPVGLVLEPGDLVADSRYTAFLSELQDKRIPWHAGRAGERFAIDGVTLTVLHPDGAWKNWGEDVNEDSLVLLVEYGGFQAILAGDAGFPAESAMAGALRHVDVLKVGHHGSRWSTGEAWLGALQPRAAIVSVGRNDYGHPAPPTLARLSTRGIEVHRTDREGTISITTDGTGMTLRSRAGTRTWDVR